MTAMTPLRWAASTALAFVAIVALRSTATAPAGAADPPKTTRVAQAVKADPAPRLQLTGRTAYDEDTVSRVRTLVDARVEKVLIKVGQHVKKGEPVAELYSTDLAAAKNDFQTRWVQWQHDLKLYDLRRKLFRTAVLSEQVWVDTQNDEQKSRLAYDLARDKLTLFYEIPKDEIDPLIDRLRDKALDPRKFGDNHDKARLTLRSPAEGVVIGRDVVPGNFVEPKDTLATVAGIDRMWVFAELSRDAALLLRPGQPCGVDVPFLDVAINGRLDAVTASQSDPDRNATLRISVPNPDGRLKADLLVKVTIDVFAGADAGAKAPGPLDGVWRFVSLKGDGEDAPADVIKTWRWTVRGGELVWNDGDRETDRSSLLLAPDKDPKAIDLTGPDQNGKVKTIRGIYRLDGDRLTACLAEGKQARPDAPRPERFEAVEGTSLIVLERVKDDPPPQPPSK